MTKKIYVTCTDRFMSGWGMASGKINKLIFVCENFQEAQTVIRNLENRSEMKYINIRYNKPYYNSKHYYAQTKTKEDYPNFYIEGYFK